jgi:hypothetical protein
MLRTGLALAVALLLGACASVNHAPISKDASAKLQGKSVVSAKYVKPDFSAFTAVKATFGLLGALAMISEGNAIVTDNEIEDPALIVSAGLQKRLSTSRNMTAVATSQVIDKDEVAVVVASNPGGDFVLDVKTLNWMFSYYPTDWAHYRVVYGARLRLIDAATKSVIAESSCNSVQGDDEHPPSKDQLLENKAALLKDYLSKAALNCADVLARDVLSL